MGTAGQGCTDSSRPVLCWRASVLFLKESRALLWTRSSGTTKIQIYGGLFYGLCCHFWFSLVLMVSRLSILWFSPPCYSRHHACVFLIHQKAIPFQSSWISASAYFHTEVVKAAVQRASTAISLPITAHQGLNPTHLLWMQPMITEMP